MIALALALADPPMPEEIALYRCFYGQAAILDDHISSAAVIAQGVVSACIVEIHDWEYANAQKLHTPDVQLFFRRLDKATPGMATEAVLKVRAAQKTKK